MIGLFTALHLCISKQCMSHRLFFSIPSVEFYNFLYMFYEVFLGIVCVLQLQIVNLFLIF